MRVLTFPIAALAAVLLWGCGFPPSPPDLYTPEEPRKSLDTRLLQMNEATLVVAGTITGVQDVGWARASTADLRVPIILCRISVQVEHVIRGTHPGARMEIYFYRFAGLPGTTFLRITDQPRPGERRVFFVSKTQIGYRTMGDVADYSIHIWSGRHPADFCSGRSPGCCLAGLLLTPGEDFNPDTFALELYMDTAYYAERYCSRAKLLRQLRTLTRSPHPVIATRACDLLWGAAVEDAKREERPIPDFRCP